MGFHKPLITLYKVCEISREMYSDLEQAALTHIFILSSFLMFQVHLFNLVSEPLQLSKAFHLRKMLLPDDLSLERFHYNDFGLDCVRSCYL